MVANVEKISLYAEAHAIEVANFVVNLGLPIDHADIRRFDKKVEALKDLFPAISSPEVLQIDFGDPTRNPLPPPAPAKELALFSNDGKKEWVGAFGGAQVLVSCRKYTRWEEIWPSAKDRLDILLGCIDPYKPVHSVDYSVTDTFSAKKAADVLAPPDIFRKNGFIAKRILTARDPRWDFNQGWFDNPEDRDQILIRVDGRSGIQNDLVVASIGNLHSQRFGSGIDIGGLRAAGKDGSLRADRIFDDFHGKNKDLMRSLLVDELLVRMRLKEE